MADIISDTMNWMSEGSNALYIALALAVIFLLYLLFTRKPREKEFKPMDLKKETKKRFNHEYRYFGLPLGKPIYDIDEGSPLGWVVGYMKVMWVEQFKRYEPAYKAIDRGALKERMKSLAVEVYSVEYDMLDDNKKRNINDLAKDELRYESVEEYKSGPKPKTVNGKIEVIVNRPVPQFMLKVCPNNFLNKLLASISNIGTDYFIFKEEQLTFSADRVMLNTNLPRVHAVGQIAFSRAGRELIEDVAAQVERDEILSATANNIPRTLHFDNEVSKKIMFLREDAKIQNDRYQHQKEGNE